LNQSVWCVLCIPKQRQNTSITAEIPIKFCSAITTSKYSHRATHRGEVYNCLHPVMWSETLVLLQDQSQTNRIRSWSCELWSCRWHEWLCFAYCLCSLFSLLTYLTVFVDHPHQH